MNVTEIRELDSKYYMPTYGQRFPVVIDHGNGTKLYDTDGKEYLDFTSGIATNCLGYNDEGFVKHICEQVQKGTHFSNLYFNEPQTLLAQKLVELAGSEYKCFFGNSGAEANECAIKLVRKHFCKEGKHKILTLKNSFHGRTMATLTATGQEKFHKDFMPLCPEFDYFTTIEELKEKIDSKTGAVMIELVQGEGGVRPLEQEFVDTIVALCKQNNMLLIVDEIQTGIGRCGTMFAHQGYGIKPDIFTLAKALGNGVPVAACLAKDHINFAKGDHGTTFGGNPLACSAGNYVLSRVNDELLAHVNEMSEYIMTKLSSLNPRGKGLLIGFNHPTLTNIDIVNKCLEKGLLIVTAGMNTVRMVPPLVITKEDADKAVEIIFEAIKELEA